MKRKDSKRFRNKKFRVCQGCMGWQQYWWNSKYRSYKTDDQKLIKPTAPHTCEQNKGE